jgi:hypothetical protein
MASTFIKLTLKQRIQIHEVMRDHILVLANGRVRYEDGWDDERVAAESIPEYPGDKVKVTAVVRNEMFGSLIAPKTFKGDLEARVKALEDKLADLARKLGEDF